MTRSVHIIGAPTSAGAYAPGPERTPAAFRRHGVVAALEGAGCAVVDRGDVAGFRWRPDPDRPEAMNLEAAVRAARELADETEAALAHNGFALVLGGDCSVELGTLAGALRGGGATGMIYIDLDVDLNAPGSGEGEGALGWMGVAHMLDLDGAEPALSGLGPHRPMLKPSDILFFAADAITPPEADKIAAQGIQVIRLAEVKADPHAAAARAMEWAGGFDQVLLHLDVDVLSFCDFPIAENIRRQAGLTFDELAQSMAALGKLPNFRALTIAQADPGHAPNEGETFGRLNAMLAQCLGVAAVR